VFLFVVVVVVVFYGVQLNAVKNVIAKAFVKLVTTFLMNLGISY
jgi:hypothetical protein